MLDTPSTLRTQSRSHRDNNAPTCYENAAVHLVRDTTEKVDSSRSGERLARTNIPYLEETKANLETFIDLEGLTLIVTLPLVIFLMLKPTVGIMSSEY